MASSGSVAGGGGLYEGLGVVDRVAQVPLVEDADDAGRRPGQTLVAGDQRVVAHQRVEQGCCLVIKGGVGIYTKDRDW